MKIKTCLASIATAALFSTTPAHAFPEDAAELSAIIAQEYGGNANLYVADEEGDFRRMGCRGRTDLMQQLFDSGLDMDAVDPDARIAMFACAIYDKEAEFLQVFLTPEWLAEIDEEYLGRRPISPLMHAVTENDYELTAVLLANDPGYYFWRGGDTNTNFTREGQLLMGAYRARRQNKERAMQALVEALPAQLIADSRDDAFIDQLEDVSRGRNRGGGSGGSGGGGGGGLFGGLGDLALGAALGGSTTDMLIASAAAGVLGGDSGEQGQAAPAAKPGVVNTSSSPQQRRLATYLYNVDYRGDASTPRASLGMQAAWAKRSHRGVLVQQTLPEGAAARAGIQQGDLITSIAGMDVEHSVELYEALVQAAQTDRFEVEFMRGTASNTVSVATELVNPPEEAEPVAAEAAPVASPDTPSQSSSMLEELERLADLRDRGVLSEEEFDALKAEILSGN